MIVIGDKALEEAELILNQNETRTFNLEHIDKNGDVIDHSSSTARMRLQSSDKSVNYVMDSCCTCTSEGVRVNIPASMTGSIPVGKYNWDMFVVTELGEQVRLLEGKAKVGDTYAMDEE